MNYALEMGSGAMIYIPSSMTTGSGIHKLFGGWDTNTDTQTHKESKLKRV
jgi:hypothetical protein